MKKRSYKQNCALALAADLLGERWTLLVFRELLIQPCRFKELNEFLAGIGTNLLTARLKELEVAGLVSRINPGDKRSAYQLTEAGSSVEPIILAMIRWGHERLVASESDMHRHHWDLLAMRALFQPARCNHPVTVQFDSEQLFGWAIATPEGLHTGRGRTESPDVTTDMTVKDLQRAIKSGQVPADSQLKVFADCFT